MKIGGNNAGLKKTLNDSQADIKKAFAVNPVAELTGALTSATGGLSSFVGKVGSLSALAAGGFGLKALIEGAVSGGENIYQLSTKMGITASEASNLNKILKLTGSDTDSFAAAMTKLDKSYSASGEAGDKVRGVLSTFGVSLSDSTGKLLPLNQQLAELSKGYKLAAENGLEQEFIMSTLGVKGLSLVQTLKDYTEASEMASKSKGVGIDPKQMHELDKQMKIVSMQAGALGSAFTGALAPIAQEVFPPIMEGLSSTAKFLAEHKSAIGSTVTTLVGLTAAYKTVGAASAIIASIGNAWSVASAQALAASTASTTATSTLTIAQERSISRMVAQSAREYAKLEAAAIKTAQASAGSTVAASTVIAGEINRIAIEAKVAADTIRVNMTAAFVAQAEAAKASSVITSEALAAQGAAATATGTKTVLAAEASTAATAESILAQERLAASHVVTGNTAVVAGEKTVSAMAAVRAMAGSTASAIWTLAGGWVGVAVATSYALYKLQEYQAANREDRGQREAIDNPFTPADVKERIINERNSPADSKRADNESIQEKTPDIQKFTDPDILAKMQATLAGSEEKTGKSDAEKATEKEAKAYENLQKAAKATSDSIKDEWISLTGTQLDALNNWRDKEQADLDASASANADYAIDKGRLDEIYAEKKKKILSEQQKSTNSIWDKALESAKEYQDRTAQIGMGDGTKQVFEIKSNAEAEFTKIRNEARDTEQSFADLSNESKLQTIQAMTAAGTVFTVSKNGMVMDAKDLVSQVNAGAADMSNTQIDLAQDTANKIVLIKQESIEKLNALNEAQLNYESALKKARDQGNLTAYMAALNSENAALTKNLTDRQLIIDSYGEAWKESHKSTTEYIMEGINGMSSGLTTFFADAISGTNSIGDAWNALGSTVNNMISNMVAEWITGRMKMWAIEKIFGKPADDATNKGIAQGAATAAAWWPAAVAVSLASFGANAGPAIGGMTAASLVGMGLGSYATGGKIVGPGTGTSDSVLMWGSAGEYMMKESSTRSIGIDNLNYMNKTGKLPGFATGGLVTGRSLSSISGRYNSAMPNQKTYEKSSGQEEKGSVNSLSLKISALDGKSVEKWLKTSGGAKIEKYFAKQASAFAASGVRL
ncbi:hypothetical protein [Pelosinus propionicus]|uniref:Tape measure domain-containing protein n=1 Tax=Pelosinus propionicus DSM 13327 TaxID=1123291 RepID=A0A1I4N1F5_9FIRM|nr:hypothetical protein [Pelosinus propionicus]SFM09073.1 hypothetical protein SAMN04490355_104015 [Pelosinus propionicus DSM 13327]